MMCKSATTVVMTFTLLWCGTCDATFLGPAGNALDEAQKGSNGKNVATENQVITPMSAMQSMAKKLRFSDKCDIAQLSLLSKTSSSGVVLKDGFSNVACVRDNMFYHGDKEGDNKDQYKLSSTGASIMHYSLNVAKEDREEMSPDVCFEFCRTKAAMFFFGIRNGRDCYCEPYFQPMADDDTMCDSLCEGSPGQVCGGESKSTVYEMHLCGVGDLKAEYSETLSAFLIVMEGKKVPNQEYPHEMDWGLAGEAKFVNEASRSLQGGCEHNQEFFGQLGNSEIADMMQDCKVFAGELGRKAENAKKLMYESTKYSSVDPGCKSYLCKKGPSMYTYPEFNIKKVDYSDQAAVQKTEENIAGMKNMMGKLARARKELHPLMLGHCFDQRPCDTILTKVPSTMCETRSDTRTAQAQAPFLGPSDGTNSKNSDEQRRHAKRKATPKGSINGTQFAFPGEVLSGPTPSLLGDPQAREKIKKELNKFFKPPSDFMDLPGQEPIMYGEREETCTGKLVKPPLLADRFVCAQQCLDMTDCVGYSTFKSESKHTYTKVNYGAPAKFRIESITEQSQSSVCFLFSKIETVSQAEYDFDHSCEDKRSSSNQRLYDQWDGARMVYRCRLKGSKFVETTIKPDPSGKCSSGSPSCIKKFTTEKFTCQ